MEPWQQFDQWQRRFENKLKHGSLAWKAFDAWEKYVKGYQQNSERMPSFSKLHGDPYLIDPLFTPPRVYVLRKLYHWTRPGLTVADKLPQRVLRDIERFTQLLTKRSAELANYTEDLKSDDDDRWLLSELVALWQRVAGLTEEATEFLSRHHQRDLDLLDQCLPLVARLNHVVKIPEQQTLALVQLALETNENAKGLAPFNPDQVRSGTVRKRLSRRIAEYAERQQRLQQLIHKLRTK